MNIKHVIPISGKDSLAAAFIQTTIHPSYSYEFIFNDTHSELPETYQWLSKVEKYTGWTINRIGRSLPGIISEYGGFLPNQKARYCTRQAKIEPTEEFYKDHVVCIYYGLRADENRSGYVPIGGSRITPCYPLRSPENGGCGIDIDLQGVYSIVESKGLSPPSFRWARLEKEVRKRINYIDVDDLFSKWQLDIYFSGRSRANCYFCFNQRQYEMLWLMEAHNDLFQEAKSFESDDFWWIKEMSLKTLENDVQRQSRIFERRVKQVVKAMTGSLQTSLFAQQDDVLTGRSCGLLCGK